jgi:hypothetical protein
MRCIMRRHRSMFETPCRSAADAGRSFRHGAACRSHRTGDAVVPVIHQAPRSNKRHSCGCSGVKSGSAERAGISVRGDGVPGRQWLCGRAFCATLPQIPVNAIWKAPATWCLDVLRALSRETKQPKPFAGTRPKQGCQHPRRRCSPARHSTGRTAAVARLAVEAALLAAVAALNKAYHVRRVVRGDAASGITPACTAPSRQRCRGFVRAGAALISIVGSWDSHSQFRRAHSGHHPTPPQI